VLVPTFTYDFEVTPLPHQRPARNGWDYDKPPTAPRGIGRVYTTDTMEIERYEMGAIPVAVVAMPERVRGNHPLCSFTAVGPLASDLIAAQAPLDVYAPLTALAAHQGAVVLMGVGVERMTLLHLAEKLAGRNLFWRWANGPNGQPMEVEMGGCAQGFHNLEAMLAPLMRRASVGSSTWRVLPAHETLQVAAQAMQRNPQITHCGRAACWRCNDAVQGGPILTTSKGASKE
jgi:aminoglycoside 3-N-acetyltransferase